MFFAFIFESVGGGEWLVLLAVILIVVGPKNLPAAARKMGQIMSTLRRAADEFKRQLMTMDQEMQRAVEDVKKDVVDIPSETAANDSSPETEADSSTPNPPMGPTGPDGVSQEEDVEDRAITENSYEDFSESYGVDETGEPIMPSDYDNYGGDLSNYGEGAANAGVDVATHEEKADASTNQQS